MEDFESVELERRRLHDENMMLFTVLYEVELNLALYISNKKKELSVLSDLHDKLYKVCFRDD